MGGSDWELGLICRHYEHCGLVMKRKVCGGKVKREKMKKEKKASGGQTFRGCGRWKGYDWSICVCVGGCGCALECVWGEMCVE